jgi:hypothetical protein
MRARGRFATAHHFHDSEAPKGLESGGRAAHRRVHGAPSDRAHRRGHLGELVVRDRGVRPAERGDAQASRRPFMSERGRRFVDVVFVDAVFTVVRGAPLLARLARPRPSATGSAHFGRVDSRGSRSRDSASRDRHASHHHPACLSGAGRGVWRGSSARAVSADRRAPAPARRSGASELLPVLVAVAAMSSARFL